MQVVIVESAAKAKTINKYLGSGFKVLASFGHVRDLPSKDGSVQPDNDFEMSWDIDPKSTKIVNEIARAVKGAEKLILATDPDREGEAISWHLLQILEQKRVLKGVEVERVAFNAVTKQAILDAIRHPRQIDGPLVSAYLARRALDYLVGFTLSPVLWRKLPGAKSAGRVQSVALRLVCDREDEIDRFKTEEYWTIEADLATAKKEAFKARLQAIDGKALKKFDLPNEAIAMAAKAAIDGQPWRVAKVESKSVRRNAQAPFTTSTLQQEASRKLGFGATRTMQVAQKLYEGVDLGGETVGLITYMRTDGVQIVPEAIAEIRDLIRDDFGPRYTPPVAKEYKTKAKNAQEAHEAVRPTDVRRKPADMERYLDKDAARLYQLVWQRAVASQMSAAEMEQTTADIEAKGRDNRNYGLRATGTVVTFDGFMRLYEEGRDDKKQSTDMLEEEDDESRRLPALKNGDPIDARAIEANQHFTEPPPRYTEATIVKKMEELGIGRPSTYASTLSVLRDRDYVRLDKKRLIPEDKGRVVTTFLKSYFTRYVEFDFTAGLEEKLDLISAGDLEWKDVLRDFWRDFSATVADIKDLRIGEVLEALNEILGPAIFPKKEDGSDPRLCPACSIGQLSLRIGKNGAFVGCSNYPDCRYTRSMTGEGENNGQDANGRVLGVDPETGLEVSVRIGRFGPFVQLGEPVEKERPKRASIPRSYDPATLELEMALKLLSLPREVGLHPETGQPIVAGIGRYGPFVEHQRVFANLDSAEEVFSVGLNRAVSLLAEKAAGRAGGRQKAAPLKTLGEHPELGGPVEVYSGRYGPYVKHGKINATIPRDIKPEDVVMEQAVKLIAERAAKAGSKPARKTAAKKAPAKKAAAKAAPSADKPAARKTAAKKKPAAASKSTSKAAGKPKGGAAPGAKANG